MASKLVDHISFQVKKLIVGLSPSKKEAVPKDAPVSTTIVPDSPVTTTTVPVHEMLFGAPMPMEFTNSKIKLQPVVWVQPHKWTFLVMTM
jgi:predicted SpoU family rRNA methylase